MKFSEKVLAEIIECVRLGLSEGKDISDLMREIDVVPSGENSDTVDLSDKYLKSKGRA